MSTEKCVIVIAGILQDRTFTYVRFIAESLSTLLPNFNYNVICKDSTEWKIYDAESKKCKCLETCQERRNILIIGAGRSMCHKLVPQLIMTKEFWLSHELVIKLYDEPGCFFKVRRIFEDAKGLTSGLDAVKVVYDIPDGLHDCEVLICIDALLREEFEGIESWLYRNYKSAKELSMLINNHAPSHMKILLCSLGPTCFFANVMHKFVTNIPKTNIVAVGSQYGLELIYVLARSTGFPLKNFGCPPVWGFLGINQFVDVHHMIQKYDYYLPNRRALEASDNAVLPIGVQRSQLRWFFYMVHNKTDHYKEIYIRKSLTQYQVGRSEDFQNCRAICDLLKLWYSAEVGDEILSLGVISDGSFGIPKGLVFSQPVYLEVLEDQSRVWKPFKDFPKANMPVGIFQSLVDTAVMINEKFLITESRMEHLNTGNYKEILTERTS
ncbi:putative malate dehydrogenase 1B [Lasioglossum baleicum]|uniref:putative malate dehydrogenase 1B n=1 Tax=Lasioglossum baleicum TaxID=434251 RepID=UPI003FCC5E26